MSACRNRTSNPSRRAPRARRGFRGVFSARPIPIPPEDDAPLAAEILAEAQRELRELRAAPDETIFAETQRLCAVWRKRASSIREAGPACASAAATLEKTAAELESA